MRSSCAISGLTASCGWRTSSTFASRTATTSRTAAPRDRVRAGAVPSLNVNPNLRVLPDDMTRYGPVDVGCLRPGTEPSVEFLGIVWTGDGRRLRLRANDSQMKGTIMNNGCWSGTRREMASILGSLLWWRRVAKLDDFTQGSDMQVLRRLYTTYPPADQHDAEAWREPLTLDAVTTTQLTQLWQARNRIDTYQYDTYMEVQDPWMAACDASKSDQYRGIGVVDFGTWSEQRDGLRVYASEHRRERIAAAELEGICRAVELCPSNRSTLLVIANDNTNALCWVERRYGPDDEINQILAQLYAQLDGRRIVTTYVRGEYNAADQPSRVPSTTERDLEANRVNETRRVIRKALKESIFRIQQGDAGQAIGHRIRQREQGEVAEEQ